MGEEIFLPTLSHWRHKNSWTGSWKNARFAVEVEGEELVAQLWRGPLIRTLSSVEGERRFPVTQEGLAEVKKWVLEQAAHLESCGRKEQLPDGSKR